MFDIKFIDIFKRGKTQNFEIFLKELRRSFCHESKNALSLLDVME